MVNSVGPIFFLSRACEAVRCKSMAEPRGPKRAALFLITDCPESAAMGRGREQEPLPAPLMRLLPGRANERELAVGASRGSGNRAALVVRRGPSRQLGGVVETRRSGRTADFIKEVIGTSAL
jgi:hypothetical protein